MIDDNGYRRSLVLPKWLEYKKSAASMDLNQPLKQPFKINQFTRAEIRSQLNDFKIDPSAIKAADIMGASIVIDDYETATEMASFLLKKGGVGGPTNNLAEKILDFERQPSIIPKIEHRISINKKRVIDCPHNSIGWMELARLYTIKGQIRKAKRATEIALNLNPVNRYLVRSGARFFIHIDELDQAYYYVSKALENASDPWIKSLQVNIKNRMQIEIGNVRKYLPAKPTNEQIFHHSELFESIGMLELNHGNIKKAKKLFRTAWKNPCESVVRHAEWVLRNKLPGSEDISDLDIYKSHEARAWHYFHKLNPQRAIESITEWELEEPYSASPFVLGAHVADSIEDYENAIAFAERGLMANPNHFMLNNNLCYSLLKANRLIEAKDCLKMLTKLKSDNNSIFINANTGLFHFRKGNIDLGRKHYYESITKCRKINDSRLAAKAVLNLVLAELEAATAESRNLAEKMIASIKETDDPSVYYLKKKVLLKIQQPSFL